VLLRSIELSQYRACHFQGSLNGVAERFMRTIKEQCLWSRLFEDTDDLRQGVATFIQTYNDEWLIERLGHRTPREAFNEATAQVAA
jgi:putative transposase